MKFNLKFTFIFAHVSIFLCVVKKRGKIGQNQEYRDEIEFEPHFTSKYDNCDRMHQIIPGVPKKVTDLIKASIKNLARINRKSSLNCSLIVYLKIDTLFGDIRTLRENVFILKAQICLHLETRAFRFRPKIQTRCFGESPQGHT